jgi:hypothetical protein
LKGNKFEEDFLYKNMELPNKESILYRELFVVKKELQGG